MWASQAPVELLFREAKVGIAHLTGLRRTVAGAAAGARSLRLPPPLLVAGAAAGAGYPTPDYLALPVRLGRALLDELARTAQVAEAVELALLQRTFGLEELVLHPQFLAYR